MYYTYEQAAEYLSISEDLKRSNHVQDMDTAVERQYEMFNIITTVKDVVSTTEQKPIVKTKSNRAAKDKYYYELTITTNKFDTIELDEDLQKILKSESFKISKYIIARELTKQGRPHYHLCVQSSKPIWKSYLKKLGLNCHMLCLHLKELKTDLDRSRWEAYQRKTINQPDPKASVYFTNLGLPIVEEIDN